MWSSFHTQLVLMAFLLGGLSWGMNYLLAKLWDPYAYSPRQTPKRWTQQKKPTTGGYAFYLVFLVTLGVAPYFVTQTVSLAVVLSLLMAASVAFLIGLADDFYGTHPFLKFLGQFACGNILIAGGAFIELTPFLTFNYVVTLFWIIGLMNAINMIDNMDGVSGVNALLPLVLVLIMALQQPDWQHILFIVMVGQVGALLGFLLLNWPPARVWMGDVGSQFMGMFLAFISIRYLWEPGIINADPGWLAEEKLMLPLLGFIIPLIDVTTVFARRIRRGISPFVGGSDHTSHQLARLGLSERGVNIVYLSINGLTLLIALWVYRHFEQWNLWLTVFILFYFLFIFSIMQILYDMGASRERQSNNS